jgi:hypothetical protein
MGNSASESQNRHDPSGKQCMNGGNEETAMGNKSWET